MRIDPKAPAITTSLTASTRRAATSERFEPTSGSRSAGTQAAASLTLGGLDALLALQGEEDPRERRRRAARHGNEILDALDRLKAALLAGRIPSGDLRLIIERLSRRPETSGDPRLDEILAHISLRAQVELAKLGPAREAAAPGPSSRTEFASPEAP